MDEGQAESKERQITRPKGHIGELMKWLFRTDRFPWYQELMGEVIFVMLFSAVLVGFAYSYDETAPHYAFLISEWMGINTWNSH